MFAVQPPPDRVLLLVAELLAIGVFMSFFAFWIWMLRDCLINELPGSRKKRAWAIFIAVFWVFGAFTYNVGRRKTRMKELGR